MKRIKYSHSSMFNNHKNRKCSRCGAILKVTNLGKKYFCRDCWEYRGEIK